MAESATAQRGTAPLALVAEGAWADVLRIHLDLPQVGVLAPGQPLTPGTRAAVAVGDGPDLGVPTLRIPTQTVASGYRELQLAPRLIPGERDVAYLSSRALYYATKRLTKRGLRSNAERLDLRIAVHALRSAGLPLVAARLTDSAEVAPDPSPTDFSHQCLVWATAGQAMVDAVRQGQLERLRADTFAQAPSLLWRIHLDGSAPEWFRGASMLQDALQRANASARLAQLGLLGVVCGDLDAGWAAVATLLDDEHMSDEATLPRSSPGASGFAYDASVAALFAWAARARGSTDSQLSAQATRRQPHSSLSIELPAWEQPLGSIFQERITPPELDGHPIELTDDRYDERIGDVIVAWRDCFATVAEMAEIPLLQVHPWPPGHDSALSVRVDIDRPATPAQVVGLLSAMRGSVGAAPGSWYAIPGWGHESAIRRLLLEEGQEMGLHVLHPRQASQGVGLTCHSAPTSQYWLGSEHVAAAEDARADHVEHLTSLLDVPGPLLDVRHRRPTRTYATPLHFPLEASTADQDLTFFDQRRGRFDELLQRGGHVIIGTHNDVDPGLLSDVLDTLPGVAPWCVPVGSAVARLRALRAPGAITGDSTSIANRAGIGPVACTVRWPDGDTAFLDLEDDRSAHLGR